MIVIEKENIISNDIKIQYEEIMKKLQFQDYIIPENHLLLDKYGKCKNENKTTMRIISEFSTFKNSLPLNWDSTIWLRVSKKNINIFSFFISGPKNTPYENGIFEFHAAFPFNYPETEPKVLLNTTGYGTVRFNPNLYNCGKVCLSLLGTWAGQESEIWNKSTSTFLQVLVSIQSLIFVEDPYFNEPGYEKQINTTIGKKNSKTYNEPLQINTIKFAINDMIKNPPLGMEEVIKQHFKFKKDEIIETTNKWYLEISDKDKLLLQNTIEEMKILLDTL
jgi:baculoviral IAP repeat-containing protein 6